MWVMKRLQCKSGALKSHHEINLIPLQAVLLVPVLNQGVIGHECHDSLIQSFGVCTVQDIKIHLKNDLETLHSFWYYCSSYLNWINLVQFNQNIGDSSTSVPVILRKIFSKTVWQSVFEWLLTQQKFCCIQAFSFRGYRVLANLRQKYLKMAWVRFFWTTVATVAV